MAHAYITNTALAVGGASPPLTPATGAGPLTEVEVAGRGGASRADSRIEPPLQQVRFAAFAEDTPSAAEVREILVNDPLMEDAAGNEIELRAPERADIDMFVRGEMRYPRAESLHVLLSNGMSTWNTVAVENGPSTFPHVSMVLASLGSRVFVKEPVEGRCFRRNSEGKLPVEWTRRHEYLFDQGSVDRPTPAHVVYWINPSPTMFQAWQARHYRSPEALATLAGYLGRDVMVGGYLVIQTDIEGAEVYYDLPFDVTAWFPVFDHKLGSAGERGGPALPTALFNLNNQLRIFRRIA